jgi:hypothetical protein
VEIIGTVYVLMWPGYGSTVNSAHSNTILENSVFETYGLLSMVPYDTGGRVAITIWGINPTVVSKNQKYYTAGLMCPRPMCPRPKILGCCAP